MSITPIEDGLRVVDSDSIVLDDDRRADEDQPAGDVDLQSLRDEFVDAFNARDLETVLGIVDEDVETPDITGDGAENLAEELQAIWERSPGAILTRAFLDGEACAVAWLPDEDGCWSRAALVCFDFDAEAGLLTVVAVPDDADALDRAEVDDPTGSEPEEWQDWVSWDRGEETISLPRDRERP
jgi:hypothetical protein